MFRRTFAEAAADFENGRLEMLSDAEYANCTENDDAIWTLYETADKAQSAPVYAMDKMTKPVKRSTQRPAKRSTSEYKRTKITTTRNY